MEENGKVLERKEPLSTKRGIVFRSKDGKSWQIDFPYPNEKDHRYGNATAERVAVFFLCLGMGHSLEEADRIAFKETLTK